MIGRIYSLLILILMALRMYSTAPKLPKVSIVLTISNKGRRCVVEKQWVTLCGILKYSHQARWFADGRTMCQSHTLPQLSQYHFWQCRGSNMPQYGH